jgi:uroporphyrin-III C-methyltransferase/precorrin-2 dehydrogenase/sirohydrochlorin ferrochelatase
MQQGISFQVVPGITAAAGCASYAGIPLTHRDHAQSCTFVTGHLKDGSVNLNWKQLAAPNQTVVIYMGLVGLQSICEALIEHGCPQDHPIAVVQQGTTTHQRVLTGTLADIWQLAEQADIKPPTLIIVGTVVRLHEKLRWFQT